MVQYHNHVNRVMIARSERARKILASYPGMSVRDLLVDLRHYCGLHHMYFPKESDSSLDSYNRDVSLSEIEIAENEMEYWFRYLHGLLEEQKR